MFAPLKSDVVTLLAMHTQTLNHFSPPQCRDNVEIWAMGHHKFGRAVATRVFEAHAQDFIERRETETTYLRHWSDELRQIAHDIPVYTLHPWTKSLGPLHYNWCPKVGHLNTQGLPFVESSIGYMLMGVYWAHKNVAPIKRVQMFGISLDSGQEYGYQKPNALYWLGRLAEAGVQIYAPEGCLMFQSAWASGQYGVLANLGPPKQKAQPRT